MAITNGYTTLSGIKAYMGISGSAQDDNLERAVETASRQIDKIAGRKFWIDGSVVVRTFTPVTTYYLDVPDIATTTGLIVKLDTNDDGTYDTTLTHNTDYYLTPANAEDESLPYNCIKILDTRSSERFDTTIVNNVQVTAKWGFASVPTDIETACLIQALRLFKRKDTPFNTYGSDSTGVSELFSKVDPDALQLIKGYKKTTLTGQII